jgi:hypothetical protein
MTMEEYHQLNKIRINDKMVKKPVEIAIDQIVTLSKSTLWTEVRQKIDDYMPMYHRLPTEEQVRQLPDRVKKVIRSEFLEPLKQSAEYYQSQVERTKKAMNINDENDDTVHIIGSGFFEDSGYIETDFPYTSIAEITRDSKLSWQDKRIMIDKYLEMKEHGETIIEPITEEPKEEKLVIEIEDEELDTDISEILKKSREMVGKLTMGDETVELLAQQPELHKEKLYKAEFKELNPPVRKRRTTKQIFATLCKKYPSKFSVVRKSGKVGWTKKYRGREYTPILITANPELFETTQKKCEHDSTIFHLSDSYYVKELEGRVYFIRVSKG